VIEEKLRYLLEKIEEYQQNIGTAEPIQVREFFKYIQNESHYFRFGKRTLMTYLNELMRRGYIIFYKDIYDMRLKLFKLVCLKK